jgi:hypothetical protein
LLFLSGAINQLMLSDVRADVGLMIQTGMGNSTLPLQFRLWAGDNGRFAAPERWHDGDWLEWAAGLRKYRDNCLFMVAPDVVADAEATLALSLPYLPTIRQLGFKAAYVSQDGAYSEQLPWDAFDCLFVGGTNAWKLCEASYALVAEAKARGKWTHMGRVNSLQRMRACAVSGFDSCDGTFLKYGPDVNWPRLCSMLDDVNSGQRVLAA